MITAHYHPRTEISTQALARLLPLTQDDSHMDVLYTFFQEQGRGQGVNLWYSGEDSNIAATFVCEPRFLDARHLFFLDMALSLGVLQYAKARCNDVFLKWPNDIYWRDHKAGGLLLETHVQWGRVKRLYFGVGLNINQVRFPASLPNAVSLYQIDGKIRDLNQELLALSENVYASYMNFRNSYADKNWKELRIQYLSSLLFKDQWRDYFYHGKLENACIRDVDEYGHLKLEKRDGTFIWVDLKELKYNFDV